MTHEPTYFTLANGLSVVHIRCASPVGYCGLAIRAGSRDEEAGQEGLAHFVEHCIFKGTEHRSADDIRNCMELVGGELNAFTGKDDTVVYTVFPSAYTRRALALVSDLVRESVFPADELEKEREVVLSEMDSYLDTPSEQIFDDFEDMILGGTPLGHNILGTADNVRRFSSADCRGWLEKYYTAANCVLFYSGPTGAGAFRRMAQKTFGLMTTGRRMEIPPLEIPAGVRDRSLRKDTHQTHVVMGSAFPTPQGPAHASIQLLTNILGGPGMNAMLNVELREKRGLVYTVEASVTFYGGCALFTVYFGCDPADAAKCKKLIRQTLRDFAANPQGDKAVAAAIRQYLGQLVIANDNAENRTIAIARATLHHGRALTARQIRERLTSLTAAHLLSSAACVSNPVALSFNPCS